MVSSLASQFNPSVFSLNKSILNIVYSLASQFNPLKSSLNKSILKIVSRLASQFNHSISSLNKFILNMVSCLASQFNPSVSSLNKSILSMVSCFSIAIFLYYCFAVLTYFGLPSAMIILYRGKHLRRYFARFSAGTHPWRKFYFIYNIVNGMLTLLEVILTGFQSCMSIVPLTTTKAFV